MQNASVYGGRWAGVPQVSYPNLFVTERFLRGLGVRYLGLGLWLVLELGVSVRFGG